MFIRLYILSTNLEVIIYHAFLMIQMDFSEAWTSIVDIIKKTVI